MKHSLRASCGSTVADGGGEKNGMEGIVVGKVGSEGMFGIGGKVICGIDGLVGKLGRGGSCVGLGSDGWVVGNGSVGKGGKGVGLGKVGTTGTVCTEGVVVCKRLRAAKLRLMLDNMLKTTKKAKVNH